MNKNLLYLVIILITSRFIGLPPNFSPLLATAIFMPRLTNNRFLQSFIPISIIILSNLFLESVHLMIFLTILFVLLISPIISRAMNNLFYSCLMVVFIWFIFVNGSVWIIGGGNLLTTYISAIPFDFKLLISTCLYLSLFHYAELIYIQFNNSDKKIIDRFI